MSSISSPSSSPTFPLFAENAYKAPHFPFMPIAEDDSSTPAGSSGVSTPANFDRADTHPASLSPEASSSEDTSLAPSPVVEVVAPQVYQATVDVLDLEFSYENISREKDLLNKAITKYEDRLLKEIVPSLASAKPEAIVNVMKQYGQHCKQYQTDLLRSFAKKFEGLEEQRNNLMKQRALSNPLKKMTHGLVETYRICRMQHYAQKASDQAGVEPVVVDKGDVKERLEKKES